MEAEAIETKDGVAEENWKKPFFTMWTGQAFSLLGSQLVQFALIWWLTQETGSATVLATASLTGLLPQVFLGPIAGTLVDRWNRKTVMILSDVMIAAATLVLALLFFLGKAEIWHIYALMFLRSLGGGFHWTAMQASTSLMAPREHLGRVQGLNQMLHGAMNIGSAPLGALLLQALPMQGVLLIDVVTAALAVSAIAIIRIPQPLKQEDQPEKTSVWQDFSAGLRYVRGWTGLLLLISMATIINLVINPGFSLLPLLVTNHFQGDAYNLAGLDSAFGVGVVAGGLALGAWGGFRKQILTSFSGIILLGLAMLVLSQVPSSGYLIAIGLLLVIGISLPMANGPLMAVVQGVVEPAMQGRVMTLMSSVAAAMTPIGMILAGPLADNLGIQAWYLIGGVVTVGLGTASFFIPALVNMEEHGNNKPEVAQALNSPGTKELTS